MQSNYIAGAMTLAFVIFITARGELPNYLAILVGGGSTATPATSTAAPIAGTVLPGTPGLTNSLF